MTSQMPPAPTGERAELKGCPFCGTGLPLLYSDADSAFIECQNRMCLARIVFNDRCGEERIQAIAAWNRRPSPAPPRPNQAGEGKS